MKLTGAQIVTRALRDEGVQFGFGIPGTHNIELYDVLANEENFQSILVTDEQSASFMADGFSRASGKIAVVNIVPGAGFTHALSGIAEAYMDGVPMLVLGCGIRTDTGNAFQLHDIDQAAMARPVCKDVFEPQNHRELYLHIRRACQLARRAPAGPVMVIVPANLYLYSEGLNDEDLIFEDKESLLIPHQEDRESIIKLLNESQNIGLYVGLGAQQAQKEILELAQHLDAVVFTTISGKGIFPEDHPRWIWNTLGAALPPPLHAIEKHLDCLLAIGCRFGEVATASYGLTPPKNLIHIDIDPKVFHKNYKATLTWKSDAFEAVSILLQSSKLQKKKPDEEKLKTLKRAQDHIKRLQKEGEVTSAHVSPHGLLTFFQKIFDPNTVYVTDSGNGTFVAMEHLRLTQSQCFLGPIDYSCMGYSVPAAIGAKMACPDRDVVALVGDGAFLMTGLEMITSATYDTGVIFCVLRDGELSQIAQFQERSLNRKTLTKLFPINLREISRAMGIDYLIIQKNQEIEDVLMKARQLTKKQKPVLLEVYIDYSESTFFSQGVIKTNFLRFPWKDRLRLISRVIKRKIF